MQYFGVRNESGLIVPTLYPAPLFLAREFCADVRLRPKDAASFCKFFKLHKKARFVTDFVTAVCYNQDNKKEGRARFQTAMCEELYKTSMISIDSYDNRILTGRIFNPFLEADIPFRSTMEFIKEMNALLQELQFPQSFFENREFQPAQEQKTKAPAQAAPTAKKGRLATFSLRIMFRQNSSWQGSLTWVEGKLEESFRSALELLLLIDSAIDRAAA